MHNLDLNKLATQVRIAHAQGKPFCLPAMTMKNLGMLSRLLTIEAIHNTAD